MSETAINSGIGRNVDAHVRSLDQSPHSPCPGGRPSVTPVDNLLRPDLIGSRAKLTILCVFFVLLGGVKALGGLGVFIDSIVLAITLALVTFLREEERAGDWSIDRKT